VNEYPTKGLPEHGAVPGSALFLWVPKSESHDQRFEAIQSMDKESKWPPREAAWRHGWLLSAIEKNHLNGTSSRVWLEEEMGSTV
jgi:hypothetical protein